MPGARMLPAPGILVVRALFLHLRENVAKPRLCGRSLQYGSSHHILAALRDLSFEFKE
jgi:hypothetical protein